MESPSKVQVQHVTKASSDQLLRKFAEMDSCSDTEETRKSTSKRRRLGRKKKKKTKKNNNVLEEEEISPSKENVNSNLISGSFRKIEKKSLLNNNKRNNRRSSGGFVRQLGISRSYVRNCRNKFVLGAIEKTWNKAIKGASKVFMEKHYNRHRILNNSDMV